jgi:ATP-dependent Lon protease
MEKVKTRILQYMAVRKLRKDLKGPILCLVGPPGVGKTSLGKSVAKATGRRFHRIALGGARDVAEIKGHRRTYVGALPGLIVQGLKTVGVNNPVFLLDEIDKLGSDPLRGDPSSALLEVLDPEQNNSFQDHYLGIPFDLSRVLFIATANSLETIPAPLRDRMEIIRLAGYTSDEKMFIAQNYLVPKQLVEHGLTGEDLKLQDEILIQVTNDYTAEAGVRSLERQIAALCRSVAMQVLDERERNLERQVPRSITAADVENILGPPKIIRDLAERTTKPGIITGLSYSSIGAGSILFIEVACYPGDGQLCLTGSLGDVIRESSQIALSWVRSHAHQLQISPAMMMMTSNVDRQVALPFNKINVHVHFPAGAVSKDGPSAGIAICTALVSFLTGTPCQPLVAMTGELTLRGNVLPIGGVKEKVLAAHRAGIKRIILPDQNHKDVIADVPESVKREIEFVYCKRIDQVLRLSLGTQIFRIEPLVDSRL